MIKEFKNIRKYEKNIKMKFINFETSIDSFYRFFFEEINKRKR